MKEITRLTLLLLTFAVAAGMGAPRTDGKGDARAGAVLYKQRCLSCHGEQGKGDGPASKILKPKPHELSDKPYMAKVSDADLFKVIAKGGAAVGKAKSMPAYEGKLKEKDIHDLVAFIRSLTQK